MIKPYWTSRDKEFKFRITKLSLLILGPRIPNPGVEYLNAK